MATGLATSADSGLRFFEDAFDVGLHTHIALQRNRTQLRTADLFSHPL